MIYFEVKRNSQIKCNNSYEGESLERKMERVMANNEPIDQTAPMIYTERKDGVHKECDIRTDRFDVALDATDKITMTNRAKRENKGVEPEQTDTTYVTD